GALHVVLGDFVGENALGQGHPVPAGNIVVAGAFAVEPLEEVVGKPPPRRPQAEVHLHQAVPHRPLGAPGAGAAATEVKFLFALLLVAAAGVVERETLVTEGCRQGGGQGGEGGALLGGDVHMLAATGLKAVEVGDQGAAHPIGGGIGEALGGADAQRGAGAVPAGQQGAAGGPDGDVGGGIGRLGAGAAKGADG